jgi:stage V sporulation protein D (sporulation-specific penicillin-binding protein)
MTSSGYVTRVRVVTLVCMLLSLVIVGKLYVLQVIHGQEYARKADAQTVALKNPLLNRGGIYFSGKDGTLITAATLRSVASSTNHQRYYPGGSLAARTLGFVAYNNDNEQKGRYGLERYYESTLARDGEDAYANFFVELFGGVAGALRGEDGGQGDIITTLEPSVQAELERTLARYAVDWSPNLSGGIIMDPKTGEIVAMAVSPSFDLNKFNEQADVSNFGNPMAQSVFEMGSIIKPLTVAAGLDAGVITEATTYNDTGCVTLDQKTFCNFDLKPRGVVPVQEILSQSLNVGAAFVAGKLGPERMRNYFLDKYKLGSETGVDLPGEVHGLMGNLKHDISVEFATASFGQGIAMTPIETVRALATLGNGGLLVTPHLVKAVKYDTGVMRTLSWGEGEQVLKPQTSTIISRMLTTVVDTKLADGKLKMEHYSIAAKTGTAQIANPNGGGYYADKYLHSFFGYFPSYDPKFIVFLYAVEPKGAPFASQTWAPPFGELTKFLINYYNIPPDR